MTKMPNNNQVILTGFLVSFLILSQWINLVNIFCHEYHLMQEKFVNQTEIIKLNENQEERLNVASTITPVSPGFRLFTLMKSQLCIPTRSIGARCGEENDKVGRPFKKARKPEKRAIRQVVGNGKRRCKEKRDR